MERNKAYDRKEILFDEKERSDYLSGFRKRKLERRKYGLALQKLRDRKARIDGRKEAQDKARKELQELSGVEEGEGPVEAELSGDGREEMIYTFVDECTTAKFGGEVIVEVKMGAIEGGKEEEEEANDEELQRVRKERAMRAREKEEEQWSIRELVKKVGAPMPSKKRKKGRRKPQDKKKQHKKHYKKMKRR